MQCCDRGCDYRVVYITTMQCIYVLTFYLSFEAFSKSLKHLIKYCSFANLAEVFSDFSLKKNGNIMNLVLELLHVSKCALKGFFLVERSLICCACVVLLSLNFPPVCPI